jgi:hypothetical protein
MSSEAIARFYMEKIHVYKETTCPAMFADILMHISEDSCKRIENHKDFDLANKHNDFISLMEIVRLTHITLPATKIAQLAAEEDKLDNLKQIQNESLDTYNTRFRDQMKRVTQLGVRIDEKKYARKYLFSLVAKDFEDFVKRLLHQDDGINMPSTVIGAMDVVMNWYNTERSTELIMRGPSQKKNTTNQADAVANAAVTPNGGGK